MIRSAFVTEIALMIGHTDGTYDTNIINWINWGMYYLDRQCDLKGLRKRVKFPFVVGQTEYSFPDDVKYPKSLTLLDHLMLDIEESDISGKEITVTSPISTGTKVQFLNSTPPFGISANTFCYVIKVDATTIKLASTSVLATATPPVPIDSEDGGEAPHMMEVYSGTGSRKLEYILEADFLEHVADITERPADKSSLYIDKGDIFEIGNPPSEALCGELVYWKWQLALAEDNSEPEVSYIEDLICQSAVIFAWRVLEEVEKKKDAVAELNGMLAGHIRVLARHPDEFLVDKGFREANTPGRGNIGGYLRGRGHMYPGVK